MKTTARVLLGTLATAVTLSCTATAHAVVDSGGPVPQPRGGATADANAEFSEEDLGQFFSAFGEHQSAGTGVSSPGATAPSAG
ncbi:hypothetical protein [Streptomyces sp. NPDC014006]|uniref:hypothetical protein n=1 Tax=Streptomyces sp. NPDC014006 TaxID=3364870 RepID=UPI0036FDA664